MVPVRTRKRPYKNHDLDKKDGLGNIALTNISPTQRRQASTSPLGNFLRTPCDFDLWRHLVWGLSIPKVAGNTRVRAWVRVRAVAWVRARAHVRGRACVHEESKVELAFGGVFEESQFDPAFGGLGIHVGA